MPRGLAYVLAGLVVSCVLTSCSSVLPAYTDARDDWTRDAKVWEDFESRLFMDATLKTESFRREYVREYARLFSMTAAQTEAMLEAELADESKYHVVVAAIFVAEREWAELDPRDGIWDVRLQDDQERWVRPLQITRIDTDNPLWRRMYPYIDRHDHFFELRFPKTLDDGTPVAQSGQNVHLIVAGAPAQVKLSWPAP